MENIELQNIWKSYDEKIDSVLVLNREIALRQSKQRLNKQISRLYRPKWAAVFIGIPYAFFLIVITIIAVITKAYFVAIGFGGISLITVIQLLTYFYQLNLIRTVGYNEEILSTQEQLSKLRISSFKSLNLIVFQLPFWSICWISWDALKESPFIYGGINVLIFAVLCFIAYWLYQKISYKNKTSTIRDFFLSGNEWNPILKSEKILEQIKEFEK